MKYLKYIIPTLAIMAIAVFGISKAKANPSYFNRFQSATATTTVSYLNPAAPSGTVATTTVNVYPSTPFNQGADSAAIFVQYQASSTASILNIQPEYSMDGIDWYGYSATTTPQANPQILTDGRWTWQVASSTNFGTANAGVMKRMFTIPMPAKYARVLLYMSPGSQNGTVWIEAATKTQVAN